MAATKGQRAKQIYDAAFAIYTVFVGFLWIAQVWAIYFSAESAPFSVTSISAHFQRIQAFVWAWVFALIVNIGWGIFAPAAKSKEKYVDYAAQLKKLKSRLPDDGEFMVKTQGLRLASTLVWGFGLAFTAFALAVCGYFVVGRYEPSMQSAFFAEHDGAAERLLFSLPWVTCALLVCVGAAVYQNFTQAAEVALIKKFTAQQAKWKKAGDASAVENALKARGDLQEYERICAQVQLRRNRKKEKDDKQKEKRKQTVLWIARGVLLSVGVAFVIVGICNGGMADVFEKAKNICTQCIGLG